MEQQEVGIRPEDEAAIRGLLDRMGDAWARGDGDAYASVFSEDAAYVAATGRRGTGREDIAGSHQRIFDSVFKGTRLGRGHPVRLQPVTPDVVIVHSDGAVMFAGERDGTVAPNGLLTMVAARRGDSWQFVSFSNTPTGKARNVTFLWRFLISRFAMFGAEAAKARRHMLDEKQRNMAAWRRAGDDDRPAEVAAHRRQTSASRAGPPTAVSSSAS